MNNICLAFNLCGFVILLIMVCCVTFEAKVNAVKSNILKAIIAVVLVGIAFDSLSYFFYKSMENYTLAGLLHFLSFVFITFWVFLTAIFVLGFISSHTKASLISKWIVSLALCLMLVIAVIAYASGKFVIIGDGVFNYGSIVPVFGLVNISALSFCGIMCFCFRKDMNGHDLIAIVVYVGIPIISYASDGFFGTLTTTYFGISVSLLTSYLMLSHVELVTRAGELKIQNDRLQALANIYHSMYIVNLEEDTFVEYKTSEGLRKYIDKRTAARETMKAVITEGTAKDYLEEALAFTDLDTLADRMVDTLTISAEFKGIYRGWFRGRFVVIDRGEDNRPKNVIWATVIVQDEKKKEEGLIRISRTDELTQLNNRRAFEEALNEYENKKDSDVIVMSFDINGLKDVNDTLGHAAGDELILGATKCISDSFGKFGELYRNGGDEFAALIIASEEEFKRAIETFEDKMKSWKGDKIDKVSISYGYVRRSRHKESSMNELVIMSDGKMYEMKKAHYLSSDNDRRKR